MNTVKYKKLMVLLALIFFGQAMSAPLTTCSTNEINSFSQLSQPVNHMSHDMSSMSMPCCSEDECECPVGMCLSFVSFASHNYRIHFESVKSLGFAEISFFDKQPPSSIYRPPIFS